MKVTGLDGLVKRYGNQTSVSVPVRRAMQKSVLHLSMLAKEQVPVDTGRLRASITTAVDNTPGTPKWGKVGANEKYAPFVEFGTRPHWPPLRALQPWARRHGFPPGKPGAFLVARAIAARGTKAHPFMRPALQNGMAKVENFFRQAMTEIQVRLSG